MKGKIFKTAIAVAMTASVIGVQAPGNAQAAVGDFELTIMHTNDTHANLDQVAKRAGIINDIRSKKPNNLLLDAGDVFSGTLYFNTFQGQADAEMMNLMDYDAMTFGNHEFDLGASDGHQALSEFMFAAGLPFVSANADFSQNPYIKDNQNAEYTRVFEDGEIYNGIIKEIDGEEVGIFGLTTAETKDISSPGDVTFSNYIEAAEEAVAAFEAEGVDKIIALTHIGLNDSAKYDNDMTLAAEVPGIDVIVGGHTHTKIQPPIVVENGDPIVIVQANEYGKFLGQLDVTFDEAGVITSHTGALHDVAKTTLAPDATVAEALKKYSDEIETIKNEPTGAEAEVFLNGGRSQTPGDGVGVRSSETNLGNLITDGMLAKAKTVDAETVIAVQNGGGIRASIDAGPITYGEVLTTLPFGNSLAIMDLTGAELKTALEHSVSEYPKELGSFLHVAGMKFTFDPARAVGSRVTSVSVKEGDVFTALDTAKNYKVATNTFVAAGGDGYTSFGAAYKDGRVSEPGFTDFDMFVDHVTSLAEVNPAVEGRIVAGASEEPAEMPFTDVDEERWSYTYVKDLFDRGIINGTSDTTFSPLQELPRWQAVTLMVRTLELDTDNAPKSKFTDIGNLPPERQAEINAAYAAGLIKGATETKFNPKAKISRDHFALIMNRMYEDVNGEYKVTETAPFKDISKLNAETKKAITMLYDLEIVEGYNNNYMPAKLTSREETAKVFSLFLPYSTK